MNQGVKKEELVIIGLRLIAIYVLTLAVEHLTSMYAGFAMMGNNPDMAGTGIGSSLLIGLISGLLSYLTVAAGLFFAAPWLTRFIVPGERTDDDLHIKEPASPTQIIILQAIGVYLLCMNVPALIGAFIHANNDPSGLGLMNKATGFSQFMANWPHWIAIQIRCLLGLFLIFGAKRIRQLLQKAQPMKAKRDES